MTFSMDNPGGLQQPLFGKYVWEKPSGEQGLNINHVYSTKWQHVWCDFK